MVLDPAYFSISSIMKHTEKALTFTAITTSWLLELVIAP